MKHFIYTYERKRNDVNGNPKHWVTVYRMKRNVPELLEERVECGYVGEQSTVIRVIVEHKQLPATALGWNTWTLRSNDMATIHRVN